MEPLFENSTTLSVALFRKAYKVYYFEIKIGWTVLCSLLGGAVILYSLMGLYMTWPAFGTAGTYLYWLLLRLVPIALGALMIVTPWLNARRAGRRAFESFARNGLPLEVTRAFSNEGVTATTAQSSAFQAYAQMGTCYFSKGLAVFYSGASISTMEMGGFTQGNPEDFEDFLRAKMRVK